MSCSDINFSVDENCEGTVTFDMIANVDGCSGPFTVDILDDNGDPIPTSPDVNSSHLGQTFDVRVTDESSGQNCWSKITVEDKIPPMVDCDTVMLNCYEMINFGPPVATDNCSDPEDITVTLLNEERNALECDEDSVFIKEVVRTYQAIDEYGTVSEPCEKVFLLERIDTDSIEFPANHSKASGNPLVCDGGFPLDPNGNPDPSFTGVPQIDSVDLFPLGNFYCNIFVDYEDTEFPPVNCKQKIVRQWIVTEHCGGSNTIIDEQIIEIVDTTGPTIVCPDDLTVTTSSYDCNASVYLPPAEVDDNCNDVKNVDITYPGGFLPNSNGGFVTLPAGENEITYTAYDDCFNSTSCTMTVTVEDNTPPVAVCDAHTVVSLNNFGTAKVFAETVDDGSHDECSIDSMAVRRMSPACGFDTQFRPFVKFNCCDVGSGPIMVVFRVWDEAGNTNECMVEVEVQDKLPAIISCPPDITVSCEFPFDLWDLSDFGTVVPLDSLAQLNKPGLDPRDSVVIDDPGGTSPQPKFWGLDGYAYDNCDISITVDSSSSFDQCGEGQIIRKFTAEGPGGVVDVCFQTITVQNQDSFYINEENPDDPTDDVEWPDDYTSINGECTPQDLDPENLPDQYGFPKVDEGVCDLVGIGFEDWVFNINDPSDPACFKVLRKWKIIDWCDFKNGEYTVYTYTQVIKILNSDAPEFISDCDSLSICSYDPDCGPAFIDLTQLAEDDCTPDSLLDYKFDIDLFNNGTFDTTGFTNDASGTYPVGTHRIIWTVEDKCGNKQTCTQIFEIRNCKKPNAYCLDGLSASLSEMDLDGDGVADTVMVELWAEDFDAGSKHPCGYDVTVSFSEDPTDQRITFNCSDVSMLQVVTLFVTDENGNQNQCNATIDIQDPFDLCDTSGSTGTVIAGTINTPSNEFLADAGVELSGDASKTAKTDENGLYSFSNLAMEGTYTVTPQLDKKPMRGVSTYDLVLIQKHILNKEMFDEPHQFISADIDASGHVSAADIVDLRKLILGITDDFTDNTSWRFVDEDYAFTSNNPLDENYDQSVTIDELSGAMMDIGFKAMKIGDINLSYGSEFNSVEDRDYTEPLTMEMPAKQYEAGQSIEVPVYGDNFEHIAGYQFTLSIDPELVNIRDVKAGSLPVTYEQNFGSNRLDQGILTTSWNDAVAVTKDREAPLFTIVADLKETVYMNEVFTITSDYTEAVAYDTEGNDMDVALDFREEERIASNTFELMQNRPNPFEQVTTIGYTLPKATEAQLKVFDVNGRLLYEAKQSSDKGYNEMKLNTTELNHAGVMYYQLSTDRYTATKKMIVIQ